MDKSRLASNLIFWAGVGFILGTVASALSGCGDPFLTGDPIPPVCPIVSPIVDGELSTDRRATALVKGAGGGTCTATVVGPNTALTAAHCENLHTVSIEIAGQWAEYPIIGTETHPDYAWPFFDFRVVYVEDTLIGPYAVLGLPPDCSGLVAQGYGRPNLRELYERPVTEEAHFGGFIVTSAALCGGDSGGPLWAMTSGGYIQVGLATYGPRDCQHGESGYGDVNFAPTKAWLEEVIR